MKGTTALLLLAVALVASATAKQLPLPQIPVAPASAIEGNQDQAVPSDLIVIIESKESVDSVDPVDSVDSVEVEEIVLLPNGCPWNPDVVWFIPDILDCTHYYHCSNGRKVHMKCPPKLHWNHRELTCDWPERAECISLGHPEIEPEEVVPLAA